MRRRRTIRPRLVAHLEGGTYIAIAQVANLPHRPAVWLGVTCIREDGRLRPQLVATGALGFLDRAARRLTAHGGPRRGQERRRV